MIDTKPDTIAAYPGYSIFNFNPTPEQKPAMTLLQEMVRGSTLPVIAWERKGDALTPLTIFAPPAGAQRFLLAPGGKIYALDDPAQPNWANFDLFAASIIAAWAKTRAPEPQMVSVIPGRRGEAITYA
jgi:hypothetical protein